MQGVGNDFVVLDAINQTLRLDPASVRKLADRHFGVGCDQVLLIERPRSPGTDFYYRIFNADGGRGRSTAATARAAFCATCATRGSPTRREIRVETLSGVIVPKARGRRRGDRRHGGAGARAGEDPVRGRQARADLPDSRWTAQPVEISALSMGNPHAVQVVADVEAAPVLTQGPLIERHARFPERVNAGYMQVVDRHRIKLRVYERGAGETLACGTGACAAVVAGISARPAGQSRCA